MNHVSNCWLCPDCDFIGPNGSQCAKCSNRCGLINMATVLNRKPPLMAETVAILNLMREVGRELL